MEWMRFKQNTDRETDQLKIQSISFIIISPRLVGYLSEMYDLKKKVKNCVYLHNRSHIIHRPKRGEEKTIIIYYSILMLVADLLLLFSD